MHFENRKDAALKLIPSLSKFKNDDSVVLAVPRGGVPVAYYIAKYFNLPIELLMTKKIGHPSNPEFAIGAVSLEDAILDTRHNISMSYIESEIERIRESLIKKYHFFMGDKDPMNLENKTIIIVDDGIATGNTILSSISMLRKKNPKKIVVAVPVCPPETAVKIKKVVDEFICPYTPNEFFGVGYHYLDFSEVPDEEVVRLLKDANHFDKAA
jgi:putative phosphoribosyl transferase